MLRKICEVFTKEYRKETEYREFVSKMAYQFKLNDDSLAECIPYFHKHKKSA